MTPSDGRPRPGKSRRTIGAQFEQRAAEYFQKLGFEVIEKNWQAGHREIDLIIKKDRLVVFVEVKSSSSASFGHPAERVDKTKKDRLISAAQQYLLEKNIEGVDLRFDVVTFAGGRLEHFPDAFEVGQ
ncbi:MAG: YraN family protein [candidate division Zixibacteria bacterium]|nr:YraN family protein [candidate division Zixibacteria bacterium]